MGTWPSVRVAFILGSLFMSLLIIVYWENLNPLNVRSMPILYGSLHIGLSNRTTKESSQPVNTSRPETTVPTTKPSSVPTPDRKHEEGEQQTEDGERGVKQERRKEETVEEEEKESSGLSAEDLEQKARKQRIVDVCSEMSSEEFPAVTRRFNQIPTMELDHFIVDDKHRIIYCYVPKVACSNWKKVMMFLSESLISPSSGRPYTDPKEIPIEIVHNVSNHLTFDKFPRIYGSLSNHLMAVKLQTYTKFLFVRDPFVRLISAFRNKLGKPNQTFYKIFGSVMLRRYGQVSSLPDTAEEAFAAGLKPTFQQFITYLLDPLTERGEIFNEHWRQVYRLCHPCQVKYDFIGRLETLDRDAEQLLKLLKLDNQLQFPSVYQDHTVASWVRDWFAEIPIEKRRKLYKLYEPDFKLFGYPKPDCLDE